MIPPAVAVAVPVVVVAGVAVYTAEHGEEMAAELRRELAALRGFHPVKRARLRGELAALEAFLILIETDDGAGWDYHAGDTPTGAPAGGPADAGPAPWEPPAPGWEVGP